MFNGRGGGHFDRYGNPTSGLEGYLPGGGSYNPYGNFIPNTEVRVQPNHAGGNNNPYGMLVPNLEQMPPNGAPETFGPYEIFQTRPGNITLMPRLAGTSLRTGSDPIPGSMSGSQRSILPNGPKREFSSIQHPHAHHESISLNPGPASPIIKEDPDPDPFVGSTPGGEGSTPDEMKHLDIYRDSTHGRDWWANAQIAQPGGLSTHDWNNQLGVRNTLMAEPDPVGLAWVAWHQRLLGRIGKLRAELRDLSDDDPLIEQVEQLHQDVLKAEKVRSLALTLHVIRMPDNHCQNTCHRVT